jgi:hypothetical protein
VAFGQNFFADSREKLHGPFPNRCLDAAEAVLADVVDDEHAENRLRPRLGEQRDRVDPRVVVGFADLDGAHPIPATIGESTDPPALLNRQVDPFAGAKAKPKAPKVPAGVLSKGQLSGKGWQKTIKVSDLGQFGKALEASDPKGACNDSDEKGVPKALSGGASLFVRGAGGEAIGELDGRYKTAGQAEATMEIATSARSMRCLAASLTSSDYKAKVAANGPDFGQGGVVTNRVVLKHGGFTGYVDVVGLADGRSNTVLVFFNHGKPAEVSHEEDVLEAVADDLRP